MAKTLEKTIQIMEKKGYKTHFDYRTENHILKIAFVKKESNLNGTQKIIKTMWGNNCKVEHYATYEIPEWLEN